MELFCLASLIIGSDGSTPKTVSNLSARTEVTIPGPIPAKSCQ